MEKLLEPGCHPSVLVCGKGGHSLELNEHVGRYKINQGCRGGRFNRGVGWGGGGALRLGRFGVGRWTGAVGGC